MRPPTCSGSAPAQPRRTRAAGSLVFVRRWANERRLRHPRSRRPEPADAERRDAAPSARPGRHGVTGTGGVAVGHSDAGCDFYADDVHITATVGPAFRVTNARTIEQPHPESEHADQLGLTDCRRPATR